MSRFHYTVPMEHMGKSGEWILNLSYHGLAPQLIKCPDCNGTGLITGFRASYNVDGSYDKCGTCYGNCQIKNPEWVEPKPPQELVNALSKVMRDAWNKAQNDIFKLDY